MTAVTLPGQFRYVAGREVAPDIRDLASRPNHKGPASQSVFEAYASYLFHVLSIQVGTYVDICYEAGDGSMSSTCTRCMAFYPQ